MSRQRHQAPTATVGEPRAPLLLAVLEFVRAARICPGVRRIALMGSLTTSKALPKDADVLVSIAHPMDLTDLARAGRRLKGVAQAINLGADIFLANESGTYVGRICQYRQCHPRMACHAQHCGRHAQLYDDLHIVKLAPDLIMKPPLELWPRVARNIPIPEDVEALLLGKLE